MSKVELGHQHIPPLSLLFRRMMLELLRLPWYRTIPLAMAVNAFCIFTTTLTNHRHTLRWVRLVLVVPQALVCWAVAYPPYLPAGLPEPGGANQFCVLAILCWLRTIDICLLGFWDKEEDLARRLIRKEKRDGDKEKEGTLVTVPLPTTMWDRLVYTIDYLQSVRGESAFKNHTWHWAPKDLQAYNPSRKAMLLARAPRIVFLYLVGDVLDHIFTKGGLSFDRTKPYPVTSLPMPQQLFYGCLLIYSWMIGFDLLHEQFAVIFVGIFQMHPSAWPPFYWGPFTKTESLADFWSRRWHAVFRRAFVRWSRPTRKWPIFYDDGLAGKTVRWTIAFFMSALIHIAIANVVTPKPGTYTPKVDPQMIKFFMGQVVGLVFEAAVVLPLTNSMGENERLAVRRIYVFCWFAWTGRWAMDHTIPSGQFDQRTLPWSPIDTYLPWLGSRL